MARRRNDDPALAPRPERQVERQVAFRFGLSAESRAAAYLIAKGHRIVARRWRSPVGEIDIVARRRGTLVFVEVKARERLDDAAEAGAEPGVMDLLDLRNIDIEQHGRGRVSADVGRAAYEYLERATQLALADQVGAIVTAPLNKEALSEAGWVGVGHTELLARFAGVPEKSVAMMLASNRLRVVHVSTHVSLRRAIEQNLEDVLAEELLKGTFHGADTVTVKVAEEGGEKKVALESNKAAEPATVAAAEAK